MLMFATLLSTFVALLHLYFLALEMFFWTKPLGRKAFGLKADFVATGNPGCLIQLQQALDRKGEKTRVVHTVQVIDASIRGSALD